MKNKEIVPDLTNYAELPSPNIKILYATVLLSLPTLVLYLLFFYFIPNFPHFFYEPLKIFFINFQNYSNWINDYLKIPVIAFFDRIIFLIYVIFYISMWLVYFNSKISDNPAIEAKRYKVRTLRRLLGMTSLHWSPSPSDCNDNSIENYKKKAEVSMIVIALFIAVSILIFDQISYVLLNNTVANSWDKAKLWLAMLCVTIAFVCLMLCVDSLDTLYNTFKNNEIRDKLVYYFQSFTFNPRYLATATMFLAMILWISYHSELLASITIGMFFSIGYSFWFPIIPKDNRKLPYGGLSLFTIIFLFSAPIIVHIVSLFYA